MEIEQQQFSIKLALGESRCKLEIAELVKTIIRKKNMPIRICDIIKAML